MAGSSLRREVLQSFKSIHRTRCCVFQGDERALNGARKEINDNYRKYKNETDAEKIKDLVRFAYDVIHELKTSVIQLKETQPGRFRAHIRPEMFEVSDKPKSERSRRKT